NVPAKQKFLCLFVCLLSIRCSLSLSTIANSIRRLPSDQGEVQLSSQFVLTIAVLFVLVSLQHSTSSYSSLTSPSNNTSTISLGENEVFLFSVMNYLTAQETFNSAWIVRWSGCKIPLSGFGLRSLSVCDESTADTLSSVHSVYSVL